MVRQVGLREATVAAWLRVILAANLDPGEFFVEEAASWSMEEYLKTDPGWERMFLDEHEVAALTRREGSGLP